MLLKRITLLLVLILSFVSVIAQSVCGKVVDAETGEPLVWVNVFFDKHHTTQTGLNGEFAIPYRKGKLTFALLGYETQLITSATSDSLHIALKPIRNNVLSEAVVMGKKTRYTRKDNPAVELMKKVIAHKVNSSLAQHDYYRFDKYSKVTFAFNDVTEKVLEEGKFKRLPFLRNHVETNIETGKLILPISVDETVSEEIYRKSPKTEKVIVKGKKTSGLNDLFYTGELLTSILNDCFTDVNIYDDDIRLLQYQFTSPISSKSAISFYRYFIVDTLKFKTEKAIMVDFTPNNPQDFGFSGRLYIAADSTYRILSADITLPKKSDVNYVDNMRIIQNFKLLPTGEQVLVRDDMLVELKVTDFLQQFMVKRLTEYSHFSFDPLPDKLFKFRGNEKVEADALMKNDAFWADYRVDPLTESEGKMNELVKQFSSLKWLRPLVWVSKAFIENFVETTTDPQKGSKVDIGPVNTIISQNFVNGLRLRGSAQTTAYWNKHLFLKGYVAYGFKDHRYMGSGEVTYSFLPKGYLPREFPVSNLSFQYTHDVMAPSDKFMPTDKDNVFTSLKWTKVNHMMYFERYALTFDHEWENNLRLTLQLRREKDEPTAALFYQRLDNAINPTQPEYLGMPTPNPWVHHLVTTDLKFALTYSPGAKWVNTKQRRYSPNFDYPIYKIQHTLGLKNVLGGDYAYNLTEASVYRRFWLNSWGKIDVQLKGGIQWNKVPYPLLIVPEANLSYIMQENMFNLISNMEFLNDRYVSLMTSWDLNGKLFNRIPLFNRLKWREFIGCNVLWGDLSRKNNPFLPENRGDSRLFYFPGTFNADGTFDYISRPMNAKQPYVEVMVGIHNIFKVFHIEYVKRLTYTEHLPKNCRWGGIRGMFRVTF